MLGAVRSATKRTELNHTDCAPEGAQSKPPNSADTSICDNGVKKVLYIQRFASYSTYPHVRTRRFPREVNYEGTLPKIRYKTLITG